MWCHNVSHTGFLTFLNPMQVDMSWLQDRNTNQWYALKLWLLWPYACSVAKNGWNFRTCVPHSLGCSYGISVFFFWLSGKRPWFYKLVSTCGPGIKVVRRLVITIFLIPFHLFQNEWKVVKTHLKINALSHLVWHLITLNVAGVEQNSVVYNPLLIYAQFIIRWAAKGTSTHPCCNTARKWTIGMGYHGNSYIGTRW